MCHISSTPTKPKGAEVPLPQLLPERLHDFIDNHDFNFDDENLKIKISGDGARMTRNTCFTILSFALLQNNNDLMSARGTIQLPLLRDLKSMKLQRSPFPMFLMI